MLYVLAYPVFDPHAAERIRHFRETHEPQRAQLVPPHITLVFGVADGHLRKASGLLEAVSQRSAAFPVTFDRHVVEFDPFERTHKTFLLCGAGSAAITALHDHLYDGPHRSEFNASHPFKPHMSIGTHETRKAADQAYMSAVGPLPITAKITSLALVKLEDGRLTELISAPLSGETAPTNG